MALELLASQSRDSVDLPRTLPESGLGDRRALEMLLGARSRQSCSTQFAHFDGAYGSSKPFATQAEALVLRWLAPQACRAGTSAQGLILGTRKGCPYRVALGSPVRSVMDVILGTRGLILGTRKGCPYRVALGSPVRSVMDVILGTRGLIGGTRL
jgi:hypothetical protein